jgi:linoleoyl-CoA desaturase
MKLKFEVEAKDEFFPTLTKRVNHYFESRKMSKHINVYGVCKGIFLTGLAVACYYFVITADGNAMQLMIAYSALGFLLLCLALTLGHEGVHNSYSKSKKLNHALSYVFDFVGTSGYLWKLRHVYSHHPFTNINGHDIDIRQSELLTLRPMETPKRFYRYQHLYLPFLYLFYTLNALFKRDWEDFFSAEIGNKKRDGYTFLDYFTFFFSKAFYLTYSLVIPLWLSGVSWPLVLAGFMFMHFFESITAATALFPAHIHEDTSFPEPDPKGNMHSTWAEHQMKVTMDFGTANPLVAFFFGGINYHVVHHLFPTISHVHFPAVAKIIKSTANEFGVEYIEQPSLMVALNSHMRSLKRNGIAQVREVFAEN